MGKVIGMDCKVIDDGKETIAISLLLAAMKVFNELPNTELKCFGTPVDTYTVASHISKYLKENGIQIIPGRY